jgi:hypothetical protein
MIPKSYLRDPINSPKLATLMECLYISLSNSLESIAALHELDEEKVGLNPYAKSKLREAIRILKNLKMLEITPVVNFVHELNKHDLLDKWQNNINGIVIDYVEPVYSRIWDNVVETSILAVPSHEKVYAFRRSREELEHEISPNIFCGVNLKNVLCFLYLNRLKAAPYIQIQHQGGIDWQKDLNFLRINLSDAFTVCNSLNLDDFVLDPHREELGIYFIASAKLTKVDILPYIGGGFRFFAEDNVGKKIELHISSNTYWDYVQETTSRRIHPERFLETCGQFFDLFCCLGYSQRSPTILAMKPIKAQELEINQTFAYIRFRKRISSKKIVNSNLRSMYPGRIIEHQGVTYYVPHCINDAEAFLSYILDKSEGTRKRIKDYISHVETIYHFFRVNRHFWDVYAGKIEMDKLYYPSIEIIKSGINTRFTEAQIEKIETEIEQEITFDVGYKVSKQQRDDLVRMLRPPREFRIVVCEYDSPNLLFLKINESIQRYRPKCVVVSAYLNGRKVAVDTVNLILKRHPNVNVFSYTYPNGAVNLLVHFLGTG